MAQELTKQMCIWENKPGTHIVMIITYLLGSIWCKSASLGGRGDILIKEDQDYQKALEA